MALTARSVTTRLKSLDIPVECFKGDGYIYFIATTNDCPEIPSVYINSMNDTSVDELVDHVKGYLA